MKKKIFLITFSLIMFFGTAAVAQQKFTTCAEALKINVNNCLLNSNVDSNSWQDCIQYGMDSLGFTYNDDYYLVGEKNFQCFDNNATGRNYNDDQQYNN